MKKIYILFLLLIIRNLIFSQVHQVWVSKYYGPQNWANGNSLVLYGTDNIYVAGNILGSNNKMNYCVVKYNSSGIQQWVQTYNGPTNGDDYVYAIAVDSSGNVYVTGYSAFNSNHDDIATVKYNSSGVQQWVQRYTGRPGNGWNRANAIASDNAGNIYITGTSNDSSLPCITIKYNTSGVQQWVKRYVGSFDMSSEGKAIALDISGNIYITGIGGSIMTTIKYDSSGNQQWVKLYAGPGSTADNAGNSITVDNSGNVYVGGFIDNDYENYDYCTIKYNSTGVQQWVRTYNGPINVNDVICSIVVDNLSNVFVTGTSGGIGPSYDYCTIKYNSAGVQQWLQRYHGNTNYNQVFSLSLDDSSNVYITGTSGSGVGNSEDYCTIKYNTSGIQQWVQRYNSTPDSINSNNQAYSIRIDQFQNVYVTGYSSLSGTAAFCTIKYSQITGLKQLSSKIPKSFQVYQNFPNPFNPITNIKYQIPKTGFVRLFIYDVLGRELTTSINEKQNAGVYEVQIDGSNYPSGVYFYKLIINDEIIGTKKMIVLK